MLISCSACFRDLSDLTATGTPLYVPRYTVPSPPVAMTRSNVTFDRLMASFGLALGLDGRDSSSPPPPPSPSSSNSYTPAAMSFFESASRSSRSEAERRDRNATAAITAMDTAAHDATTTGMTHVGREDFFLARASAMTDAAIARPRAS